MARGPRRFDRRIRPVKSAEKTDIIPAITDPINDAEAVTGDDIEDLLGDFRSPKANAETPDAPRDRRPDLRGQAVRVGRVAGQWLMQLAAWLAAETRKRLPQAGRWLRPRLTRLGASIVAGLLLCSSYPPFNWWWAAIPAFAVLSWVLTRPATTPFGGFGYGFVFGVAFYLPLIRWISILVGATPLLALVLLCAVFPG